MAADVNTGAAAPAYEASWEVTTSHGLPGGSDSSVDTLCVHVGKLRTIHCCTIFYFI